ncbi:MAG: hypothetical protein QF819_07745 [Gemmatimonadota bacterium]|jgi:hypothetical protein|nr:hypothetical protein [Gemmatimonadota bacterium]MDP6803051.1 hypothetical protein [Gemmatimonadota bacterium]MDP7032010.1 hypothetical protein [Gemmatimonadota bacterium]
MAIERIEEPIVALVRFGEGGIRPMRFRWRNRDFTVAEVAGTWIKRVGEDRVHFFSLGVGTQDYYEISYEPRTSRWKLMNIYLEG